MGDFWSKKEDLLKHVQALRKSKVNVFGEPPVKVPCDNISEWLGKESCDKCPDPCDNSTEECEKKTEEDEY